MIDYSGMAHPKPQPRALERIKRRSKLESLDKQESAKARARANGRCEVLVVIAEMNGKGLYLPCHRKDTETHHLISGNGRRNRGNSILAVWKLRVCKGCHEDITRHILQPTTAQADALSIRFRRVR